jgi:tetratricopeptide (TPR) repeat protein
MAAGVQCNRAKAHAGVRMLALPTLSGLFAPLLIAGGVLLGIAVADTQEVYFRELLVPPTFTQRGYSQAVALQRIHDNLLALERRARTRPETQRLETESEAGPLGLIAQYLNITLIARALQDSSRLIEYTINGSIVQNGDQHTMHIRIAHRDGQRLELVLNQPTADIEGLLQDAAVAILSIIDPHILCTIRLRDGLGTTPPNLAPARDCVANTMPTASRDDRVWLFNLAGVIAFLEHDHAGSVAAFRTALHLDPDFSPALLNLGILLAENGRHEEAIHAFRTVFRRVTRGESPQTYAATYTEWGNSLMALGRPEEARERYADAVRADPRYALAYFFWANSLPPGPQAEALRRRGEAAQRANDQLYTENLVGVIRETRVTPPN